MTDFDPEDIELPPPPSDDDAPPDVADAAANLERYQPRRPGGSVANGNSTLEDQLRASVVMTAPEGLPSADAPAECGDAGSPQDRELSGQPAPISLDPIQRQAVELACAPCTAPGPAVITGGPGTGKTTTLRYALDRLDVEQRIYELAAPTGKAAKRCSEATGRPARTIHRLLEYNPNAGGFQRTRTNPLDTDVVVVDETSMVDIELAGYLLDACDPRRTRVVLVGDADQLPSVGPGRVLADLVEHDLAPVVRLKTLHRSAAQSWVHVSAPLILAGETPDLHDREDFRFVEVEDAADIAGVVRQLVTEWLPQHTGGAEAQVLSPQRTGKAGIVALNCTLQDALNPARKGEPKLPRGDYELRAGDRVIQRQNNYTLDVYNGEVGDVVSVSGKGAVVNFGDRELEYSLEQADALQLAYALTIHSSQGSEFPWVVVVCHSTHTHMLTRQLFYTAVTRAKQGVVLVGNKKGISVATSSKEPPRRNTGLVERMKGEI